MKNLIPFFIILAIVIGCKSSNITQKSVDKPSDIALNDTIKIANDSLEYEVIIFEPGFNAWIVGNARQRGYYSENFLESRNYLFITEWNLRVNQPFQFDPNLYQMQIDYDRNIHYGYEVNYLIYNYMIFFQTKYKQRLSGFVPRP
jgi:hypothetical protein